MKKLSVLIGIFALLFFIFQPNSYAKFHGKKKNKEIRLNKTTANPKSSLINVNNITCWVREDGFHDWIVANSWNGAFPNGANVGAIFTEGIVWGGQVNDGNSPLIRVNGNTYGSGGLKITRLFRVRPDYKTGDLTSDAASFFGKALGAVTDADIQSLRAQYEQDWNEWPADEGALFEDVDGDGVYNPSVDIPGVPGASQTIFIKYSDANSSSLYASPPIGLEVSETYWAYAFTGALGNVIYKKVDIVYKGTPTSAPNSRIDSMYIVQWADPDVGQYSDDFAGCDTLLNLGYAYSSQPTDAVFESVGLAPPAVGYDFLQGVSVYTGNPADSAIFNLKWRKGYKYVNPKPMSSFAYFSAGGEWSDPSFDYTGTLEFYNLMRGKLPDPPYPAASPFPEAVSTVTPFGTYLLDGDPVAGTGKIDGVFEGPSDRRIMVTNGPITLNLGDTAQVVVALVGGLGTDNLSSVRELKNNDNTAQIVYDQLFQLPSIAPPDVKVTEMHNQIILNWGTNPTSISKIENFNDQGYAFEGYEVYQLPSPSASLEDGVLLATYDAINGVTAIYDTVKDANGTFIPKLVADGKDYGISRFLSLKEDAIKKTSLKDGQSYYYAVVAYAYNPSPLLPFHALKSAVVVLEAVPQQPLGMRVNSMVGDTLEVTHTKGKSNGEVIPIVVDPTKTTGHKYKVTFDTLAGGYVWNITDMSTNKAVASNQTNQTGDNNYPIFDGLLVKVVGPPVAINHWSYEGTRWVSGTNWGGSQFFGGMDLGINFFGSNLTPADYVPVQLRFVGGSIADTSEANGWSRGAVYRRDLGYPYVGLGWLPFTAWDMSDPDNPRQLDISFIEDSANGNANMIWDMGWDGSQFADLGGREYIFIHNTTYSPGTFYDNVNWAPMTNVLYAIWPSARGSHPYLEAPFTMDIVPNYVNLPGDEFEFSAPEVNAGVDLVKADVEKINVFPNPYYGYQYRETSRDNHYVTFNHLPDVATIRIFDLSGVLVKTIKHDATNGQFETWNLQNDSGYPVASGIYIVHIDMPQLGKTKILKLALVQEQQILKVY